MRIACEDTTPTFVTPTKRRGCSIHLRDPQEAQTGRRKPPTGLECIYLLRRALEAHGVLRDLALRHSSHPLVSESPHPILNHLAWNATRMEFLQNTDNIRNICILAHVDHGKTTIADSLIASNGIISHKMAGKMRYLDNRQDEQERGITMKSSSIALKYSDKSGQKYLVNLVDTPGHVDFCGEVSAAVILCDGALIVVDVVEGVCPQTKVALEQAWKEGIEPILVLNKIDRLILEQRLDETAAYLRLNQLLEQVNAMVATLLNTELFEDESSAGKCGQNIGRMFSSGEEINQNGSNDVQVYDWASAIEDLDDSKYYFMPEKDNVIFSSSIDGWAFNISTFSKILSHKHKINLTALQKTLWGDFYIDIKQKKILKNAQSKAKKTLFTSMVLENIWKIYDIVAVRRDKVRLTKICDSLNIVLTQRDINHTDGRYQAKLILSKWLPLSMHVLDSVSRIIPSPRGLSEKRVERLLSSSMRRFNQLPERTRDLKRSFMECSTDHGAIKVAFISKMIPVDEDCLPENRRSIVRRPMINPSESISENSCPEDQVFSGSPKSGTIFIAFARIFSGRLQKGDKLFVLGPKHDPDRIDSNVLQSIDESKKLEDLGFSEHVTLATVESFYLLMGRDIEEIDCALAGNIVGIRGLERHLVRTATLSSNVHCPPFNDLHLPAAPILRVAVEPKNPTDSQTLIKGLKLLNQADPCVEVKLQQTGEHVIVATGEVHLQHCIKDLRERYANNIELNVSPPIVPFRETIVLPPKTDMVNETIDYNNTFASGRKQLSKSGIVELFTPNRQCRIKLRATPLPDEVVELFAINGETLKIIARLVTSRHSSMGQTFDNLSEFNKIELFKCQLNERMIECRKEKSEWRHMYNEDFVERIWSFGPKYGGPNILVAGPDIKLDYNQWSRVNQRDKIDRGEVGDNIDSFISGFQMASQSGPLCEEPMMGVCFTIIDWSLDDEFGGRDESDKSNDGQTVELVDDLESVGSEEHCVRRDNFGPLSGQIISTVKESCRKAFQAQPKRLMSPMFSCDIQVTAEVLGKMYAVLGRRHGRVLHGDMREGSQTFEIKAFIPVIESLDFVNEIRKQTSGMANPQLIFSHYETVDVDPFWTPSTEEEYALFGEKADTVNLARKYMNLVRRRKGLPVQEKIVEHGEKQRTIKRNK